MLPTIARTAGTLALVLPGLLSAQFQMTLDQSVQVTRNGPLPLAWVGGLNVPQVSDIDLNGDGLKDIFLFDRVGNKPITLLNQGTAGQVSYTYTNAYDAVEPFPRMQEWVLLRDYNGDGKEDIFMQTLGGLAVWKNVSTGGQLAFNEVDTLVRSNYVPTNANLYITQVDIPGIEDVDGDGDLDILTFGVFGSYMEYHKNLSMELQGNAEGLIFEVRNRCWGYFYENVNNNTVSLDAVCPGNVPNSEVTVGIERAMAADRARQHTPVEQRSAAHVGSTILPLDLDNDGDKDLIIGDVSARTLLGLTNGGTLDSAHMIAQDSLFPVYDETCLMDVFPAAYYEDVNNDGRRDLLVAPNYPALSENQHSLWYYLNNGTDAAPIFHYEQDDLFQDRMLDFGEGAYPVPFDADGDGLMDLMVGNYGEFNESGVYPCKIGWLRNTGTATSPAFDLAEDDYMGLSTSGIGNNMFPAFGDVDGDGDKDMYIGDLNGKLHHYRNDPVGAVANFTLQQPNVPNDQAAAIDVGQFAAPQFFDVDDDGLLDLLIGERNGNVNYYHNNGTVTSPVWHLENDSVGGVVVTEWWNVTGYSVPHMFLNQDGERELLVGSESGWVHWFDGIEGNVGGVWNLLDSTWQGIREGGRTALCLHDFTGDGAYDAVIGNFRGGLSYWRNDVVAGVQASATSSGEVFSVFPNPASGTATILLEQRASKNLSLDLLDGIGRSILTKRITDERTMIELTGVAPGVYTVRLFDGKTDRSQRLVIFK